MHIEKTNRGFTAVVHDNYPEMEPARLLQESSVIRDYDDALDNPGSSCLWIGDSFHLDREEVREMITHMERWLTTGSLAE